MRKVLITDDVHPVMLEEFEAMGFSPDYFPDITYEETEQIISNYSGLIVNTKIRVDKNLMQRCNILEFIGRIGSGMEHIDVNYATNKGIQVFSAPEGNANAVGEHALGLLLALLNNISKADAEIRNGTWKREENRGVEISGKTVGIIGFGNTGTAFAKKLKGFDCKIMAYDKYKSGFGNDDVSETSFEALIEQADIISLHIPLTSETKYMVNSSMLGAISKKFFLINTSRGGVIHTQELIAALQSGKVLGAGLDVFENEKFYDLDPNNRQLFDTLKQLPNVVMTPHIAGWTFESKWKLAKILTDKIKNSLV